MRSCPPQYPRSSTPLKTHPPPSTSPAMGGITRTRARHRKTVHRQMAAGGAAKNNGPTNWSLVGVENLGPRPSKSLISDLILLAHALIVVRNCLSARTQRSRRKSGWIWPDIPLIAGANALCGYMVVLVCYTQHANSYYTSCIIHILDSCSPWIILSINNFIAGKNTIRERNKNKSKTHQHATHNT